MTRYNYNDDDRLTQLFAVKGEPNRIRRWPENVVNVPIVSLARFICLFGQYLSKISTLLFI